MTGQVFFREASKIPELNNDRRLLMFVGVVAVTPDSPLNGEHQYTITGTDDGVIVIHPNGRNLTEKVRGRKIGDLLLEPMWRV